jgi:hypothetical protein
VTRRMGNVGELPDRCVGSATNPTTTVPPCGTPAPARVANGDEAGSLCSRPGDPGRLQDDATRVPWMLGSPMRGILRSIAMGQLSCRPENLLYACVARHPRGQQGVN